MASGVTGAVSGRQSQLAAVKVKKDGGISFLIRMHRCLCSLRAFLLLARASGCSSTLNQQHLQTASTIRERQTERGTGTGTAR